ncbi:transposase [Paenibacillus larvae]|nr:hypothetical protein [Paenibacillus larvae]MDT2291853.1 transposase [Paenibacillus larvae]
MPTNSVERLNEEVRRRERGHSHLPKTVNP